MENSDMPSIEQIENLILSLYQPNEPQVIASTQATLTRLQGSPAAWSIARDLLTRPDEKVKFHGALILIIKLNTESHSLSDADATELLVNLVRWYLESLVEGTAPLVTRKLASALATFLIHCHRAWPQFIQHLVICLAQKHSRPPPSSNQVRLSDDFAQALENLEPIALRAALWVVENVAEDVSKLDLNAEKSIGLYGFVMQNIADAVALMGRALTSGSQLHEESIKCLQSWVWFAQRTSVRDKSLIDALRPLITLVIEALASEAVFPVSVELMTDILANHPGLLTQSQYEMLATIMTSQPASQRYCSLMEADSDFDSFQFGQLLLAFADATLDQLMHAADTRSTSLLSTLCSFLSAHGHPGVDDKIFVPTLEFWANFAETLSDETDEASQEEGVTTWHSSALDFVLHAVSRAWQKISYPSQEEFSQWDSSERVMFHDARKDVADFLQSTFTLAGARLVFKFAELVLEALSSSAWARLEAAVYCLGSLADCIKEDTQYDEALSQVFSASLIEPLRQRHSDISPRVRQTCVSLIEKYNEYFERNVSQLPDVLNLLFTLVSEPALATQASRSIFRLCSSCRCHLHRDVDIFLAEYYNLSSTGRIDCITSERIIGGIACVAQALPDLQSRLDACGKLVNVVEEDVQRSLKLANAPGATFPCPVGSRCLEEGEPESPALHQGLKALKCLSSIGHGFQSPTDGPIDIDASKSQFTYSPPGLQSLQQRIFAIIVHVQGVFQNHSEVIACICTILRCGFSECEPGPFVFHPHDVAQYLIQHNADTPRIGSLVITACSFVSSLQNQELQQKEELLSTVLLWVIGLLQHLQAPESDPELSQTAIEFASHLISRAPLVLIHLQPPATAEFFFLFTLRVLDGKEPLPKAAAADFWCTFLNPKNSATDVQKAISQAMDTLGPLLCLSLIRNVGGNALRSELDKLSEPLKKLVVRHTMAKRWLETGLYHEHFPSTLVSAEQKALFLKKIISLRGTRATNQVVREFWLAAKGSSFAYAS